MKIGWIVEKKSDDPIRFVCDDGTKYSDDLSDADVFKTRQGARSCKRSSEKVTKIEMYYDVA